MIRLATLLAAALLAGAAFAHDYSIGGVKIDHPWSRATPPGAQVAVGYMRIVNTSDAPVTLVGGSADFADVQLHSMTVKDGMMLMEDIPDGLTIAPGESLTFEPGGLHLMFTDIDGPFVEGETRKATLDFGEAGTVEVDFSVGGMGATHDHGAMTQ
ncbi:MAG: copper chaperone PCu(A)C [Pseudomonadota bacterium]